MSSETDQTTTVPDPTPSEGPDPYGNPDPDPAWRRIEWRPCMRWIDAGGARVNVVDLGEGTAPPCVLIHGLAGAWQDWLETAPALAEDRRVIAFDLPGFGHSPLPGWELTIEAYGRFLAELLDSLEIAECALIGHSMGGFIAAEAGVTSPGRYTRLGLLAAAGISSASAARVSTAALAHALNIAAPLVGQLGPRALRRPKLRAALFAANYHEARAISSELLYEMLVNSADPPGFVDALTALIGYDIQPALATLETPTLIAWGRNDRIVPPADALELGRLIRRSETVILDRTGHMLQIERPVRLNRVLRAFLAG